MTTKDEMQSMSVRRARLAEPDKVRYRVYTSPSEFVAVIAETALMAVRVSGIEAPYKIVRDLPTSSITIDADKLAAVEAQPDKVHFTLQEPQDPSFTQRMAELPEPSSVPGPEAAFVPMALRDLPQKNQDRTRILPADLLTEIIEAHQKSPEAKEEPTPVTAESIAFPLSPEPETEAVTPPPEPEPEVAPEPMSPDQLKAFADEVLPAATQKPREPQPEVILSQDDVKKLLDE